MTESSVDFTVEGAVGRIVLNRPERGNALTDAMLDALTATLGAADEDDDVKVVVLKSAGTTFCSGYDVAGYTVARQRPRDEGAEPGWSRIAEASYRLRRNAAWWLTSFWDLRKPVIAQVQGPCLAGGNDLIAACDLVVASTDATFALSQRGLGVIHTMGLWPYHLGIRQTRLLAYTGDGIGAEEAERLGLINKATAPEQLEAEVAWLADRIALMPRETLMAHKFAINRFVEGMGLEAAVKGCAEYDTINSQNWMISELMRRVRDEGPRAAFAWRDGRWDDQAATRESS